MHLPSFVRSDKKPHHSPYDVSFVSIWNVLAFVVAVIFLLVIIFPQQGLRREISGRQAVSTVTATYLQNLLRLYPNDSELRLLLAEQEIGLGELHRAQKTMAPLMSNKNPDAQRSLPWLIYQFNKQVFYTMPDNAPERPKAILELRSQNRYLTSKIQDPGQLLILARDAAALNDQQTAYTIYLRLFNDPTFPRGSWLVTAGKAALGLQQFNQSSKFYLAAMQESIETEQRREYYMAAVDSLLAGNMPEQAYQLAKRYYQSDFNDKEMLLYMAHLCVLAGHPEAAQPFLQQLLWPRKATFPNIFRGREQ